MPRTVFVIGAGSSIAVAGESFPTGPGLLSKIGAELRAPPPNGSRSETGQVILDACSTMLGGVRRFLDAADRIAPLAYAHNSIDQLITNANSPDVTTVSKVCIAYFIGSAEAALGDFVGKDAGAKTSNAWLSSFLREYLSQAKDIVEAETLLSETYFVVFNYDRLVEHLLFTFARDRFALRDAEALAFVSKIGIEHPYGTLGPLARAGVRTAIQSGTRTSFGTLKATHQP